MISASIAYITSTYFVPHSVFTMQLAKRGDLVTHHKDKAILSRIKLEKIMEKDLSLVNPAMTLGEFVKVVANSKRNIFPVVDNENTFLGIVAMDDVRGIMFDQSLYQSETVATMMRAPLGVLSTHNTMEEVTAILKDTGAWNLPVLKKGKYVGYISKSKLFSVYRRHLLEVSED
jgi:CIC family chloride channel protein